MKYLDKLQAAELHWHFQQAQEALEAGLYIPAAITYLAAIENGLRSTLWQLNGAEYVEDGDLGTTLSNRLLRETSERGIPIQSLAFDGEDILAGIQQNKPDVRIVAVRHDLCHGNVQRFINPEYGIFTPECVRDLANQLEAISSNWAVEVGEFRQRTPFDR